MADDLTELAGTVAGPPDTPYAGGKFKLEIKIPDTYPFNPPKVIFYVVVKWFHFPSFQVRFITKIWHPNVSSVTGAICLDILKDQWAAAMTLRTVLLSVQVRRDDQTHTPFSPICVLHFRLCNSVKFLWIPGSSSSSWTRWSPGCSGS